MSKPETIKELWTDLASVPSPHSFDPASLAALPAPASRYLTHAIASGTPLASAVKLRMHGEIKLGGWHPFTAEQLVEHDMGFIWQASVRMHGILVKGSDRFLEGQGEMRWKFLGILPFIHASGADISRAACGRFHVESLLLPSMLCRKTVTWTESGNEHIHAHREANPEPAEIDFTIGANGQLKEICLQRWGNPDKTEYRYVPFGGYIDEERTFGGFTIPSRIRVGWFFGTDQFETEGEFFRATIDEAVFA